jgi:hypothetical protein
VRGNSDEGAPAEMALVVAGTLLSVCMFLSNAFPNAFLYAFLSNAFNERMIEMSHVHRACLLRRIPVLPG